MKRAIKIVEDLINSLFDVTTVAQVLADVKSRINAPVVFGQYSTLGGSERVSFYIRPVLQPREEWINGIMENAPNFSIWVERDGTMKDSGYGTRFKKKFRKTRAKSIDDIVDKINDFIDEVG